MRQPLNCSICGLPIPRKLGWAVGHNAGPVVLNGRCCQDCHDEVVVPARISIQHYLEKRAKRLST